MVSDDEDHTLTPPLKRKIFLDDKPKKPEVTFEDAGDHMVTKGSMYLYSQRSWFIPKNMVPEVLAQLHKLNENLKNMDL